MLTQTQINNSVSKAFALIMDADVSELKDIQYRITRECAGMGDYRDVIDFEVDGFSIGKGTANKIVHAVKNIAEAQQILSVILKG